ncbi:MAG: TrbC/VirB2 family protein [Clostridia bacterium]|nr:TrbC/VirB2 family protein [Clostridia bacterium]
MRNKLLIILVVVLLISLILPYNSFSINTDMYKNFSRNPEGGDSITNIGGNILGIVQVVGIGIATIMLIVIGIKYITASPQEKSQLKETLVPYVIGAILLFGASGILSIVVKFVREL